MTVFALDSSWNDFYTAVGFYIGAFGLLVGVLGFWYTILQVKKTTAAAVAAERASEETLGEMRTAFRRFIGGLAGRYLAEARSAAESEAWVLASTRSNDLADMMGQMPEQSARSADLADLLRTFAQRFAAKARKPTAPLAAAKKWQELLRATQVLLDEFQSPFPRRTGDANDPQEPTPRPAATAPGEDGRG